MHLARLVVELRFPEQLHVFDGRWRQNLFVFLPVCSIGVGSVGKPVGSGGQSGTSQTDQGGSDRSKTHAHPLILVSTFQQGLKLFQIYIAELNLHWLANVQLQPEQSFRYPALLIVVKTNAHDASVDDVHHRRAPGADMQLIPVFRFYDVAQSHSVTW